MFGVVKEERHILVKFFGIKLRLNYPIDWTLISNFNEHKVNENTILIVEINPTHKETITGLCHYLKELNYNFEILVNSPSENLFSIFSNVKVWEFKRNSLLKLLKIADFTKYERIIYNSKIIYQNVETTDLHEFLKKIPQGKKENIYLQHHIDRYFEYPNDKQIILANPAKDERLEKSVVNAHYFGDVKITPKNDITTFITIGELSINRRNCDLLINSVKQLVEQGIHNFKVEVVGNGSLGNLPKNIQQYFDIKGRLDFPQMFEVIENADYFLPLLDSAVEAHKRYMQDGTSGTFQLVYGFLKPCLLHKTFAEIYGFTNEDSIVYENNDELVASMQKAINTSKEDYTNLQNKLKEKVEKIEQISLENLRGKLNE